MESEGLILVMYSAISLNLPEFFYKAMNNWRFCGEISNVEIKCILVNVRSERIPLRTVPE